MTGWVRIQLLVMHDFEVACNPDITHILIRSRIENYIYKGLKLLILPLKPDKGMHTDCFKSSSFPDPCMCTPWRAYRRNGSPSISMQFPLTSAWKIEHLRSSSTSARPSSRNMPLRWQTMRRLCHTSQAPYVPFDQNSQFRHRRSWREDHHRSAHKNRCSATQDERVLQDRHQHVDNPWKPQWSDTLS